MHILSLTANGQRSFIRVVSRAASLRSANTQTGTTYRSANSAKRCPVIVPQPIIPHPEGSFGGHARSRLSTTRHHCRAALKETVDVQ